MPTKSKPTSSTSGKRIGYVRVSSVDQNDARQLDGVALDKTFTDKASGKDTKRPQLQAMLDFVREGDEVFVHSMDRLSRSLKDLQDVVETLTAKGVAVSFVKERLTFTQDDSDPMSMLMLQLLGAIGQFERSLIRERQREGIAIAKTKGMYKGRKPVLDEAAAQTLRDMAAEGVPKTAIAQQLGISRASVYEYLKVHISAARDQSVQQILIPRSNNFSTGGSAS
jgi:DNA invertase Pin-like site-specific DNA recombinase